MEETNTVLSSRENLSIEQCHCCDNIIFLYKNLLLKFSPDSFAKFESTLQGINFQDRAVTFGDSTEKMIINTKQQEIQMCFAKEEFVEICRALKEASVMVEVNNILYH